MPGLLSKERTVAGAGFNRWLIPPCALATHLCVGQAYALSVFNLPLTRTTYACFFTLGTLLDALVPLAGKSGSVLLFVAALLWGVDQTIRKTFALFP